MAIVSAAVWKTQNAAIATALTTQYSDSGATKVADQISNSKHPLRRTLKLLLFNPTTGVFTSNDALIDAIYAGGGSAKGYDVDRQTAPVIEGAAGTALVADATPTLITLTPVKALTGMETVVVTVAAAAVPVIGLVGNTIQLRTPIVNGQVVAISVYTWKYADLSSFVGTALSVTNNVA